MIICGGGFDLGREGFGEGEVLERVFLFLCFYFVLLLCTFILACGLVTIILFL